MNTIFVVEKLVPLVFMATASVSSWAPSRDLAHLSHDPDDYFAKGTAEHLTFLVSIGLLLLFDLFLMSYAQSATKMTPGRTSEYHGSPSRTTKTSVTP